MTTPEPWPSRPSRPSVVPDPPPTPRRVVVRRPADVLAVVPVVLGFHPEDSVVLVTFGAGPGFHARVDLPTHAADRREVAVMLARAAEANEVRRALVVVYSDDEWLSRAAADELVSSLTGSGVDVVDAIRADGERWYVLDDPGDPGTPYDLESHEITATSVYDGRVVHGSREAVRESLVPVDPDLVETVASHAAAWHGAGLPSDHAPRLRSSARWVRDRVRDWAAGGRVGPPEEVARLLVLLQHAPLRDVAWAQMSRLEARAHRELWRTVVQQCPHDLLAPPTALLAFAAWLEGDGALAWVGVERCLEVEPDYSLASLIVRTLEGAVPPHRWTPPQASELTALRSRRVTTRRG